MADQFTGNVGIIDRLRDRRRTIVYKFGVKLTRSLEKFLSSQSQVGDVPIFNRESFSHIAILEENWRKIRGELDVVLEARDAISPFQEISPDQKRIAKADHWKTFMFFGFGFRAKNNCTYCPETVKILERIPNLKTAWFSIVAPGYHIPAHRGLTKGLINLHLALKTPKDREKCYMRVGDKRHIWKDGECVVFDDTYEHEVFNKTDEERTVLMMQFERPLRFFGRIVNKLFLAAVRHTGYVQDGVKNLEHWEKHFEAAMRKKMVSKESTVQG